MRNRPAFTLIEIVVVLSVGAIVSAAVASTLLRQERLYRLTGEAIEAHRDVRDALAVLAAEIRGASAADTVALMRDSAIELYSTIGNGVACAPPTGSDLALAPAASSGPGFLSLLTEPDTGDLALIYAVSSTVGSWHRYRVVSVGSRASGIACAGAGALSPGYPAVATSYVVSVSPAPDGVRGGAPVRFIRRGRYSLYRSSDGAWYLGYRRCNSLGPSVCSAIQPLSGFYNAYSQDSARTGLLFRYFDSSGGVLSPASDHTRLARIRVSAASAGAIPVAVGGAPRTARDSGVVIAALRNQP